MPDPEFDVIVVGAGIAGSALVKRLLGQGLRLALVEARPIVSELPPREPGVAGFDSRVSAITPTSQALLEQVRAWPDILTAAPCAYRHMTVWDAEGTGAIDFDAAELDLPRLGTIVENCSITAALTRDLKKHPELTLFNPAKVERLSRNQAGGPRLHLAGGEQLSAGLLVAADGALSRIRELAGYRTREWDYGHHALVATVRTERFHQHTAWQRFLQTGPLALLPLTGTESANYCSMVWSAVPGLAEQLLQMSEPEFCRELTRASEGRLGQILSVSRPMSFPLCQRHAIDYVQEGIALIGDAAHTIHPLAGQGINLGLLDVSVLAEEIIAGQARQTGPGELSLLRRYQRRRKSENLLMMAAMDAFKRLFGGQSLPLRWARNSGMRLVGHLGPVKRQLMRHAMGIRSA